MATGLLAAEVLPPRLLALPITPASGHREVSEMETSKLHHAASTSFAGRVPPTESVAEVVAARRILVVDDNVDATESMAMLLSLQGHMVRTAFDGVAGLKAALEFVPEVAFLDIGLPGLNGYELAKQIRNGLSLARKVTLVTLTGWGTDEDRQRAKAAGLDHHLTKPVEAGRLNELLGRLGR
jgi:CheY-like chemotaxis protein